MIGKGPSILKILKTNLQSLMFYKSEQEKNAHNMGYKSICFLLQGPLNYKVVSKMRFGQGIIVFNITLTQKREE